MCLRFHANLILFFLCLLTGFGGSGQTAGNSTGVPNSERILFQSDRDGNWEIYTMRTDGSEQINLSRHPADDTQPSLSPDGHRIVFVSNRDGNSEIYVTNTDGSRVRRLTNNPAEDVYPAWSRDGRIAFTSNRSGNDEIHILNADGSAPINRPTTLRLMQVQRGRRTDNGSPFTLTATGTLRSM
ncbi:MAG: hypothetical protein DMG80_03150 [Acidobacteria bacterium]|nr:MAG: hypothetical protein DMG80_03150 [Acidobacteriota bacterium]